MQSHDNRDMPGLSDLLGQLKARAEKMTEDRTNTLTAGAEGEPIEEDHVAGFGIVRRLPDDPLCLRISIGEVLGEYDGGSYLTFRGDAQNVARVLERAALAFANSRFTTR